MSLEKFSPTKYVRSYTGKPFVSLQRGTILWVSFEFYSQYIPGNHWMELFYDKDRDVLGFKALKESSPDALKIKERTGLKGRRNPAYSVNIRPFMRYYGINIPETKQFVPIWDEKEKMFLIHLKEEK